MLQLMIITLAAMVPDFDSGIGERGVFRHLVLSLICPCRYRIYLRARGTVRHHNGSDQ
jgi:hypothetical protein